MAAKCTRILIEFETENSESGKFMRHLEAQDVDASLWWHGFIASAAEHSPLLKETFIPVFEGHSFSDEPLVAEKEG